MKTIAYSDGRSVPSVIVVWEDHHEERPGFFRAFWAASPDATSGIARHRLLQQRRITPDNPRRRRRGPPVLSRRARLPERQASEGRSLTMRTYRIVRFKFHDGKRAVRGKNNLTLEQAQAHCSDPRTKGKGWFDGYEEEPASVRRHKKFEAACRRQDRGMEPPDD